MSLIKSLQIMPLLLPEDLPPVGQEFWFILYQNVEMDAPDMSVFPLAEAHPGQHRAQPVREAFFEPFVVKNT